MIKTIFIEIPMIVGFIMALCVVPAVLIAVMHEFYSESKED